MGETQNLRVARIDKYDPNYGRFKREIKVTDIPQIGHKAAPTTTSTDWEMDEYIVDANHELFPYLFTAHSTNTAAQFIIYKNSTTTALSIQVNDTENTTVQSPGCACPLMRLAPLDTVTIVVPGALITNTSDTYSAFLVGSLEPLVSVVEN